MLLLLLLLWLLLLLSLPPPLHHLSYSPQLQAPTASFLLPHAAAPPLTPRNELRSGLVRPEAPDSASVPPERLRSTLDVLQDENPATTTTTTNATTTTPR